MDDPDSIDDSNTDSRLTSFLRQAVGIIAGEKGLTPACQLKLQSLADKIKLPREMFEHAIVQLQSADLRVDQLTRYEKAFIEFLDSEFEKLKGDVISPRMENAAIEIARDKYQIESSRAQRLLQARCEAKNLSQISHDEAREYARTSIESRIEQRVFLDQELQRQLYKLGKRWGLDELAVDQIALTQVAENRKLQLDARSSRVVPLTIVLLGLIAMGAVAFLWNPNLGEPNERGNSTLAGTSGEKNSARNGNSLTPDAASVPEQPRRYSPELSNAIERFTPQSGDLSKGSFPTWLASAVRSRPDEAIDGRDAVARLTQRQPLSENRLKTEAMLLARIYVQEPSEEVANGIVEALAKSLDFIPENFPAEFSVEESMRANEVLLAIWQLREKQGPRNESADNQENHRFSSLIQRMPFWYRQSGFASNQGAAALDDAETLAANTAAAIAAEQWNRFTAFSFANPKTACDRLGRFVEKTKLYLDEQQLASFRDEVLLSIAESDPSLVAFAEATAVHSIQQADDRTRLRWSNFILGNKSFASRLRLLRTLTESADLDPVSDQPDDLESAVFQYRVKAKYKQLKPLMNRVDRVSALTNSRLMINVEKIEPRLLPNRIAEVIVAVNLELALQHEVINAAGSDQESLAKIDRLIKSASPRLRELVTLAVDRERDQISPGNRNGFTATASDIRHKEAAMSRLANKGQGSSVEFKITSLQQLAKVARRFPDLKYSESERLAEFLLADMPMKQRLELHQIIGAFSHWRTLALALADQLEATDADMDRALTIARLLLRRGFEIGDAKAWRDELRIKILTVTTDDLTERVAQNPSSEFSDWSRLERFVFDSYRQRLALAAQIRSRQTFPQQRRAGNSATAISRQIFSELTNQSIETPADALERLAGNTLDELALHNQLLIGQLTEAGDAQWEPQVKTLQRRLHQPATVGERFFLSEQMLLYILQADRKQLLKETLGDGH